MIDSVIFKADVPLRPPGNMRLCLLPVGARMPDGTVYAGISPETFCALFVMPADAPQTSTFDEALDYARRLEAHGYRDWCVPKKSELAILYRNREAIGGFCSGCTPPDLGWYWSSTETGFWSAWDQRFNDGSQHNTFKDLPSSIRLVRSRSLEGDNIWNR